MSIWILILLITVLVLIQVPIVFALPASAIIYLLLDGSIQPLVVVQRIASGLESYVLLAIPLFIFAGNLFNSAGIAKRIFFFAKTLVGHIRGSLAHVNIFASVIFSGMSGVAQADAAGLGIIEVREMRRYGFNPAFSGAVTAVSAVIGPIIPPSGIIIIYAVLSDTSVPELFLAGIVPGLLMAGVLMLTVYMLVRRGKVQAPHFPRATFREIVRSTISAGPALLAPIFLISGILTGFATPTELGALTSVYAIILGFAYRELTWRTLMRSIAQTVAICGILVFIIAAATPFSAILALKGVPQQLADALLMISDNKFVILAIINVALLLFGCIMDTTAILLVAVPVLAPVIANLGIDPVHFGLIVVVNLLLGTLTPPFGILLYVMVEIAKVDFKQILRAVAPFYVPLFIFLMILIYVPQISLWLPRLFFPGSG